MKFRGDAMNINVGSHPHVYTAVRMMKRLFQTSLPSLFPFWYYNIFSSIVPDESLATKEGWEMEYLETSTWQLLQSTEASVALRIAL